ncbi:DUF6531 domain-containing protein [Actinocrispum wychmicini]|uniref:RHS repeat-associated protein n=1 Tax=Actinocrispum wychmicini TaxID=1213861 RepID=A0A4R2J2X7_9PSEU|nr:DUF6531 domain-containing protein [Actinocrispum wychmicini]TCO50669.1 RHS repeat-associated protein [Actinocrispum wychmicini]
MNNPLVAAPQDTTRGYSGIPLAEDAVSCYEGLSSGNWIEGGLGAVATAADIADTVANPFGALFGAGIGWLMEHFEPLRQALDWLAGKPEVIESYGQTWDNVAKELDRIKADHETMVGNDLADWQGAGAEAYRNTTTEVSDALASASSVASGLSTGTTIMGGLVAAVRTTVRDIIARLVGDAIEWVAEEAFSLGLATPVVIGQVTTAVSNAMAKVSKLIAKVTNAIKKVTPLLEKLKGLFAKIAEKLKGLRRSGEPHTATPHETPRPKGEPRSPTEPHDVSDPRTTSQSADRPFCKDDPIDVTTGEVVLSEEDLVLPGVLPLTVSRHHMSNYRTGRLFGPSWASTLDQRLEVSADTILFATSDGRRLRYPRPTGDEEVLPEFGPRVPLRRGASGYSVRYPQDGTVLEFSAVGAAWESGAVQPVTAIRHRNGATISIAHTPDGLPAELVHSGGHRVALDTMDGRVTALRVVSGGDSVTVMHYGYDDAGNLAEATNSSGVAQRFTYDGDGRLTSWTDRNGQWYRYVYDSAGRATSTIGSGGALNGSLTYDTATRTTTHTDTLGNTTTYQMNELGQVVRETNALGATITRDWDAYDRLLAATDPLGAVTRYTYDDVGNLVGVTRPDGAVISAQYNEFGAPTSVTAADGARSVCEYDEHGNLTAEIDPVGAVTRYTYENGHLRTVTDPLGGTTHVQTDAAGLVTEVRDALGAVTRHERDMFGRLLATVDPLGGVTRYGWTVEGRPLFRTLPDGQTERWRYDGESNEVEYVDAAGEVTRTEITHFDLPGARIAPDGTRTTYTYDSELRVIRITNPAGLEWRHEYDGAGNLLRETDFNQRTTSYGYDSAGRLTERTNNLGESVTFVRDVLGNVVEKHVGGQVTRFTYDPAGRLMTATAPDVTLAYERDAVGRVVAETVNGRTVRSEFDLAGQRVRRDTPHGVTSAWDYDPVGSPTALRTANQTVQFVHDELGRQVRRGLGAVSLSQAWDSVGRLTSQVVAGLNGPIAGRAYHYRSGGYLAAVEDQFTGAQRFDLDRLGRVTALHRPDGVERYGYDLAGNIAEPSRVYQGTMLRTIGRTVYAHDAQGRVVQRNVRTLSGQNRIWRYTWDAEDRLTSATTPDGVTWHYRYDPLGRRVAKEGRTSTGVLRTEFFWDGTHLVEQVDATGATTWEYQPGTFTPIAQVVSAPQDEIDARFYAIIADQIGTPTELVEPDGDLVWRRRATLWGRSNTQGSVVCPLRFAGQYHDEETGWDYNRHRYYDPEIGQYTSPDPMGYDGGDNPHAYVANPTDLTDPHGLTPCEDAANAANGAKLNDHLRQAEKYGKAGYREMPDGRIRYYGNVDPARTPGEMAGRRVVREWDPATGEKRTWQETVDHDGNVRIVRPQESITGGRKVHYHFDADGNYLGNDRGRVNARPGQDGFIPARR